MSQTTCTAFEGRQLTPAQMQEARKAIYRLQDEGASFHELSATLSRLVKRWRVGRQAHSSAPGTRGC